MLINEKGSDVILRTFTPFCQNKRIKLKYDVLTSINTKSLVISEILCIFAIEIRNKGYFKGKSDILEYILLHNQYFLVKIYKISIDFLTKN